MKIAEGKRDKEKYIYTTKAKTGRGNRFVSFNTTFNKPAYHWESGQRTIKDGNILSSGLL